MGEKGISDKELGRSPGEGRHPEDWISEVGQREIAQKQQPNPTDERAKAERISRDDALHRGGFPVAGHGERDDEGRSRSRSR